MLNSAPDRQQKILRLLKQEGSIVNKDLAKRLEVTLMTIWRDLTYLEEQGLVNRQRGRVLCAESSRLLEPAFETKRDKAYHAKLHIARYAAANFIKEGDTIAVDGGTTVAFLAEQVLPARLTIFTNSLNTAQLMLRHSSRPSVYCCGGFLREQSGTFIGREAITFFSRRRFDKYFLSASGVDASKGVTDLTLEDNEVKTVMGAASKQVVLLADRSKIGQVSHMQVMPWSRIKHFVTDANTTDLKRSSLNKLKSLHIHQV